MTATLGRSPTIAELAEAAEAEEEEVIEALESSRAYRAESLTAPEGDDSDGYEFRALGVAEEAYDRAEDQQLLESGLRALDGREQDIIRLRFYEGLTQTQIANALGISQMHVSRLIRRALETMRAQFEGDADADER